MIKILCIRINVLMVLAALAACESGPAKYATEDEGPMTVRARNRLAAENPAGLVRVGEGFERSGSYQSALNMYGQAMAADPALVEAQVAYARTLVLIGDRERGEAMLLTLLEDHPASADVRRELSNAYISAGKFGAASLILEPTLATGKPGASELLLAGRLASAGGRPERAKQLFEQALNAYPRSAEVMQYLALAFALEGNYATAVAFIQRAMDDPAHLLSSREVLATIYALSGQLNAAMEMARSALPLEEANKKLIYFQVLPRLEGQEKTVAVMFSRVPVDTLKRLSGNASN